MWFQVGTNVDRLLLFSITSHVGYQIKKIKLNPCIINFTIKILPLVINLPNYFVIKTIVYAWVDFQVLTLKTVNYIA